MSKKILSLISIFCLMLFALTACKKAEGIISIQVETEMVVGETYQVEYKLEKIDEKIPLTWKVSDTGVAELDSEALTIKALKAGSFTLTVTAKTGETASKEVTVVEGAGPATKYTISYELNGGSASNAPTEYDGTKDVTLPTPTKEGYEFKGWYETADFSGSKVEKITAGSSGNKIFYAKWEEVATEATYTITYEVNGGTLSGETTSYTAKDEVTLVAPTFAGYTFVGWYEAADFSGSKVEKLAVGTTGNKTFYAKWEEVEYTITYEVNGGTLDGETTSYTVESQDITLVEPTKEGYVFKGWYTNANLSGSAVEKVTAGSTGNKTFYAKWEAEKVEDEEKVYTITYSSNGGTLANAPTEYDGSETVYLVNPLRRGYTFQGWYETAAFAGKAITSIPKGTTGNIHLYAKWVAINYSINYNFNGGAWGEEQGATSFTVAKEIELVAPVRDGYTFKGWYKDASFSGTAVEKIGKGTVGSVDLYAKWNKIYTIAEFTLEFLADFNAAAGTSITKETMVSGTATAIKTVVANEEFYNKYQWLFEYIAADLKAKNEESTNWIWQEVMVQNAFYDDLAKDLATATTTINLSAAPGPNGRTLLRVWLSGLVNENLCTEKADYQPLVTDFSVEKEQAAFLAAYAASKEVEEPVGPTDAELLAADKEALTLVAETEADVPLTLTGTNGSVITWAVTEGDAASIEEGVLKVTRGSEDATVKLTATLTLGEATDTKEFTLVVKAEEQGLSPELTKVYVGAGLDYATLDEAIEGVAEGTTIVLAAGEYSLSKVIAKSVTIVGPNADLPYAEFAAEEAVINVAKDVAGNLNAKTIVFNGVHIKGTGGTGGITGVYFQDGGNVETLTFKSSVISDMNTFLKVVNGQSAMELTIEDCHIHTIGQFALWTATSNITKTTLMSNYVDATNCGGVTNTAAALFRVRSGILEAYNNYFKGDSQNEPGYFEALNESVVKYNTFDNVTKFVHPTALNKIVFDQNLYLDANGNALSAAPTALAGGGTITVDTTVANSAEELKESWEEFSVTLSPNYEYNINYELNGGSWEVVEYEIVISGTPTKTIDLGTYDNTGLASGIYFCDSSITPNNGLRWQYKIVLSYDSTKDAYLVVAVDAATVNTNTAAGGAENWTHAIASASTDISTYASVGQYIVIDAELSVGMNAFEAKVYDASAISSTQKTTTIEHAEKYSEASLPLELATPVKDDKEFYGWYFEADFSGERFFSLPEGTEGEVTIYARFVEPGWVEPTFGTLEFVLNGGTTNEELPAEYQFGSELALPTLIRQDYNFLGWTLEEQGTDYLTILPKTLKEEAVILYAQWELDAIYVGVDKDYETITAALEAAEEGAMIIVDAATFEEAVTIEKQGILLVGTTEGETMTTLNSVTINADNVVLEGLKLTATTGVTIKGGDNVVITECKLGGTATANGQTILHVTGEVTGLQVLDSEFFADNPNNNSHYRAILADQYVTDTTIRGNVFKTNSDTSVYIDSVKLVKVAGIVTIEENTFDWPGDNFTVFLGSSAIAADAIININRNQFVSETPMSGFTTRYADDTTMINYIGNVFHNVKGTVMEARGTAAGDRATKSKVTIANNAIQDTSSKISIAMSNELVVVDGNYVFQDIVWSNNTATATNAAADKDAALAGMTTHNVTFVTNGGVIPGSTPATFIEGATTDVTAILPRLDAMRLVGWYDNAEFAGEAVTTLGAQTADVTLYAKYEAIPVYKVTYVLNGGTAQGLVENAYEGSKIVLPTPEQLGATFLGWSLVEGSTEYITSFELLEDVTVYANWTTAERYDVTFVLNGGSINYESREALVNDFVADYNAALGHSYATGADVPTGSFANIDFHTMFEKTLANGTTVREKWLWLAEYLYELSVRDLASNNCNVLGLRTLISNGTYSGDATYGLSYAFRGFLVGTTIRPNTSYTSVDFSVYDNANGFWDALSKVEEGTRTWYGGVDLPKAYSGTYDFVGWYTNPEFTGDPVTQVTESTTLYAKFAEGNPVESITITNKVTEIKRFETLQLTWELNPTNATIQTVKFESSNPEVATVDDKGFITALTNGTATIKIISQAEGNKTDEFTLEVYSPEYITGSYVTNSYVYVGQEIELLASVANGTGTIVWSSSDDTIATVTDGSVLGVTEGVVTITASLADNPETKLEFTVTVLDGEQSEIVKFLLEQHNSNIFTSYDLGIGSGTPAYYADIYGSVSKILLNKELEINTQYLEAGNNSGDYYENANLQTQYGGLQFITFHYTAGFDATADTDNHASYFSSGSADVSIHYVTGNAGNANGYAEVYQTLDHAHGAWHAGDSGARYYSNSTLLDENNHKRFEWIPTGVAYDDCDLLDIEWTASDDYYFEINGKKTTIKLPDTWNYDGRNSNHIYGSDGLIDSQTTFLDKFTWGSTFTDRTPESFFNDQDFAVKVINGEYYMGPTWWNYSQVVEGRICAVGGNLNSIGIESCVNEGSDLWYTWQISAKLIAKLLTDNDLTIDRVKGHHFFDGKDCPQPLLENDLEIWYEFIELIKAEKAIINEYKDYEITLESNNTEIIDEHGRVVAPEYTTSASYTLTISKDGEVVDTITLASMVPSIYEK